MELLVWIVGMRLLMRGNPAMGTGGTRPGVES